MVPRLLKKFMLNSAELETLNAHKHKTQEIQLFFLGPGKPKTLFFPAHKC